LGRNKEGKKIGMNLGLSWYQFVKNGY